MNTASYCLVILFFNEYFKIKSKDYPCRGHEAPYKVVENEGVTIVVVKLFVEYHCSCIIVALFEQKIHKHKVQGVDIGKSRDAFYKPRAGDGRIQWCTAAIRLRRLGLLGGCPQLNLPYRMLYGTLRCFWFVDSSLRSE